MSSLPPTGMEPKSSLFKLIVKFPAVSEELVLGNRIIQAIHTPGHSPGSMVYLTESEALKVLFGQDVHGPIHADLQSNKEDYQRSLELMLSLDADILCEGHFGKSIKGKRQWQILSSSLRRPDKMCFEENP